MGRRAALALLGAAGLAGLAAGGIAWRAPQVYALAAEGFPAALWPAPGDFAVVAGAAQTADPPPGPPPPPEARARLDAAAGRALLAERHGVLLAEGYGPGIDRETRLNSYSMVKSLVGALTLRAVAEGRLRLDQPLRDILGPAAPEATVEQALTMTAGLVMPHEPPKTGAATLDDDGFSPFGPFARLHAYGIAATMADLRVDSGLRGAFRYQSADTALLGLALERVWGRPLPDLLSGLIWRPAGAAEARWRLHPAGGGVSAYCCLYARPLDWLRVGRFILDNGTEGDPFLPDDLWRRFVLPDLDPGLRRQGAYGDQIRHDVLDRPGAGVRGPFAYFAGLSGQMTYLLPAADAVVVRFGGSAQLLHSTVYDLFPAAAP